MCDMAVIVQDQVSGPGVAGVAFSRDPNTGDPGKITVAASYGLEKTVDITSNYRC
jgi:phosphoenolpyruvate synthase/pyruvate phosphate dikinase